jgi:hypothetical protein
MEGGPVVLVGDDEGLGEGTVIVEGRAPPVLAMPVLCHVYQVADALASGNCTVGEAAFEVAQINAAFLVEEIVTVPCAIATELKPPVNVPESAALVAVVPEEGRG